VALGAKSPPIASSAIFTVFYSQALFGSWRQLLAAISATVAAYAMRQRWLAALRAGDHVRRSKRIVGAAFVAFRFRSAALGYGHRVKTLAFVL